MRTEIDDWGVLIGSEVEEGYSIKATEKEGADAFVLGVASGYFLAKHKIPQGKGVEECVKVLEGVYSTQKLPSVTS